MKFLYVKIALSFYLLSALLLGGACNLLDQQSPNDIDATTAITDAASAEAALLGCYAVMQQPAYYGGQYPLLCEALADNATTGGYNVISLIQLSEHAVTPTNQLGEDTWIAIYRVITNCNYLLEALPAVADLSEGQKALIERETRAIRALAHFDLLRLYGEHWDESSIYGIPVITKVQTTDDRPSRASVRASYDFITSELIASLGLAADAGRGIQFLNEASINALLARVYLYRNNKTNAANFAEKVITSGDFALLAPADYPTFYTSRRTSESIFELAFTNQNRSDYNGLTYSREDAVRPEITFLAAKDLDGFFQGRAGDLRATMLNFDPAANDPTILPDGRTQKYRGEESKDNPAYILRLAEMYLIRAEALGVSLIGVTDLNTLRAARGLAPLENIDEVAFAQAIADERRAELNFEGHRAFDLSRTRQYGAVIGVEDFRGILPIPNREIIASEGAIVQNPGY